MRLVVKLNCIVCPKEDFFLLEKQLKLVTRNVNYFYEKCLDFYYAMHILSPKWNEIISEFLFYEFALLRVI